MNGRAIGKQAKHAASALAFGKDVTIQTHGHDKYKRTLADVTLPDGMNVNQEHVKQGWCWWYRKYELPSVFRLPSGGFHATRFFSC
jgi:micrococcal nuclease